MGDTPLHPPHSQSRPLRKAAGPYPMAWVLLFTGFACGVEFWSFLENAAQLSDAPLFRWLKRYVRRRMRKEAGDV